MKFLAFTLRAFLFIFGCVPTSHAQDFTQLKKNYCELSSLAFKAKIIHYDAFKKQSILDVKYYTVDLAGIAGQLLWRQFRIKAFDPALHFLTSFDPETSTILMASQHDSSEIIFQTDKWDSLTPCHSNLPSFSSFSHSFPLVDCFYPEKNKKFRDSESGWYFKDRHPVTGAPRKVWINKVSGLVDSIHEFDRQGLSTRIAFTYYYTVSAGKTRELNAVPEYYPLTVQSPHIMQNIHTQIPEKIMTFYDSADIRNFISNNDKLLLMDFWFIGCKPCHQSFPLLNKIRRDYDTAFLDIIAFNPFDERSEIHYFRTKNDHKFNMQYDALHLNLYFQVTAYPCTILMNRDGEILYRHSGINQNMDTELREILDRLKQ
jgi:thiol-disulfide isomerase/thioredoxin